MKQKIWGFFFTCTVYYYIKVLKVKPVINKIIPKHLIQIFQCSMEECGSAASEVQCI